MKKPITRTITKTRTITNTSEQSGAAMPSRAVGIGLGRIVTLGGLVLAALCYGALARYTNIYVLLAQGLILLLGFWDRRWPVYALALVFPLFGNQPGSPYGMFFIDMTLWFVVGRWLWLRWRRGLGPIVYTPVTPWILLIWVVSLLSLLPHLREQAGYVHTPQGWMKGIYQAYQATAFDPLFPVHAFLDLTLSVLIFFFLADQWRRRGERLKLLRCLVAGAIGAMVFGLLDFLQILPLGWFRPPNPEILKFGYARLQSFFWHSGWFAQWLVLLAPMVLAYALYAGSRPWRGWRIVAGVFAFSAVVVMLLTYQRGGWLALAGGYGVVIFLYAARQVRSRIEMKRILAGLLILLVAGGGAGLGAFFLLSQEQRSSLVQRMRHTGELRDRTAIWQSALVLSKQNPVLGVGLGRYYGEHIIQFPKGHRFYSIDKGEAHNSYLHIVSERGPVALVLVLVFFGVLVRFFYSSWNAERDYGARVWWSVGALGMIAGWLIYGCAQYMFYIRVVDLTFWALLVFALAEARGVGASRYPKQDRALHIRDLVRRMYLGGALEKLMQERMPDEDSNNRKEGRAWTGLSLGGFWWLVGPLVIVIGAGILLRFLFGPMVEELPSVQKLGFGVFSYIYFVSIGFIPWMLMTGGVTLAVRRPEFCMRQITFLQAIRLFMLGGWLLFFIGLLSFLVDIQLGLRWKAFVAAVFVVIAVMNLSLLAAKIMRLLVERYGSLRVFVETLLLIVFFATPVLYPFSALPSGVKVILALNPVLPAVRIGQSIFFEQSSAGWLVWAGLFAWTALFAIWHRRLARAKALEESAIIGRSGGSADELKL